MANTVGGLVVNLGLNAAQFTAGLTKSQYQASKFAKTLESEVGGAARFLKGALAGITVGSLVAVFNNAVEGAAKFKQLSEEIGDTAEAIGGLQSAANTSGVSMEVIAAASVKLTAALSKADAETSQVGQSIKALGLNFSEFKALSPVAQMEAVASAMKKFEDGAGKTSVAVALFSKTGAQVIPFLNDLADAGGRNVRLTQEQIEAADKFAKQLGALKGEIALAAQAIAVDLIPTVSRLIKEFTDGIRIAGGYGEALRLFGLGLSQAGLEQNIAKVSAEIERLEKLGKKDFGPFKLFADMRDQLQPGQLADERKKLEFLLSQRQSQFNTGDRRNADRQGLAKLDVVLGGSAAKTSAALKERASEAQRFLESLEKQLEKTRELTVVEQVLLDIQKGRLEGLTPALQQQILAVAEQIDAFKALEKELEEGKKKWEEDTKAVLANAKAKSEATSKALDAAEAVREGNENLRDEIAILLGGDRARSALAKEKVDALIVEKEKTLELIAAMEAQKRASAALAAGIDLAKSRIENLDGSFSTERTITIEIDDKHILLPTIVDGIQRTSDEAVQLWREGINKAVGEFHTAGEAEAAAIARSTLIGEIREGIDAESEAIQIEINLLKERRELLDGFDLAKKMKEEAEALQDVKNLFSDALTDPLTDFVTGVKSAKDAFRAFADDLTRQLTRIASQNLANAIFGGTNQSGPDFMSVLAKMAMSFFGGGAGGLTSSGGGFGEHFAMGGISRGGFAMVGENGPEMVNLPRGAQVTPNDKLGKLGNVVNIHQNINVMPGANTASARQAAGRLRDATLGAVRDR